MDKYKGHNIKKTFDFAFGFFTTLLVSSVALKALEESGMFVIMIYIIFLLFISIVTQRIYIIRGILMVFVAAVVRLLLMPCPF